MDSKKKTKSKIEREKRGTTYVYCMYCREPVLFKDLMVKEGRYDVCKKEECQIAYTKEKKFKQKISLEHQRKRLLEENYPDPSWMTGE